MATLRKKPAELTTVGPYQLGDIIGRGAFGVVSRAIDTQTGEVVAIKQFELRNISPSVAKSLVSEIELLRELDNPNIVKYIDFVQTETHLNLVLEYMEQGSLVNVIKQFGSLPERLISMYVNQTLQGLQYLHSNNVTHCDIKCANILCSKRGELKLTDFGVSKIMNERDPDDPNESKSPADVAGSAYWMAPEVIQLDGIKPAADIWSLGCTIIELITGNPPYSHLQPMAAMFHIVQDPKPSYPEAISNDLVSFLDKCFKKDPESRPTAAELLSHPFIKKYDLPANIGSVASTSLRSLASHPPPLVSITLLASNKKPTIVAPKPKHFKPIPGFSAPPTTEYAQQSRSLLSSPIQTSPSLNRVGSSESAPTRISTSPTLPPPPNPPPIQFPKPTMTKTSSNLSPVIDNQPVTLSNILEERRTSLTSSPTSALRGGFMFNPRKAITESDVRTLIQKLNGNDCVVVDRQMAKNILRAYGLLVTEKVLNNVLSGSEFDAGKIVKAHQAASSASLGNKQHLLKAFELLDGKKSGVVHGLYFRKLLTATGERVPDREAATFLSKHNGAQKFSYKEFIQQLAAIIQLTTRDHVQRNLELCLESIKSAAKLGAQAIFLPEAVDFLGKRQADHDVKSFVDAIHLEASQRQLDIFTGLHVPSANDKMFNSYIHSPSGTIYNKRHLFDVDLSSVNGPVLLESKTTEAGTEYAPPVPLQSSDDFKVGMAICYDVRFPYLSHDLKQSGATILTFPSAFTLHTGRNDHWEVLLRARAIETQCFVVAPAQVGIHSPTRSSWGQSMVIDPWGRVLCQCPSFDEPDKIVGEVYRFSFQYGNEEDHYHVGIASMDIESKYSKLSEWFISEFDFMIQPQTVLKVVDNSGASLVRCFNLLKRKTPAGIGSLFVGSVIQAAPPTTGGSASANDTKCSKGQVVHAIVVRTRKETRRSDGSFIKFDDNACVVVDVDPKKGIVPKGTRVTGVVAHELRKHGLIKILSLAPQVV